MIVKESPTSRVASVGPRVDTDADSEVDGGAACSAVSAVSETMESRCSEQATV